MAYQVNMHSDITENVINNLRRYVENGIPFCDHLKRNIPQALVMLDRQIEQVEKQVADIREQTKKRVQEKIEQKRYTEIRPYQETQAQKIEPLNNKISTLKSLKKEIQDAVKTDQKRVQDEKRSEAARRLERKKDTYRREVGFLNGYKTPQNLIEAIRVLYTCLQGTSAGKGRRVSLEQKLETFLSIPDRYEDLKQLRKELEREGAIEGLYAVPELDPKLTEAIEKTYSRASSILGYDLKVHSIVSAWDGRKSLTERKTTRSSTTKRLEQNKTLHAKRNEEAKQELIAEGYNIPDQKDAIREPVPVQAE